MTLRKLLAVYAALWVALVALTPAPASAAIKGPVIGQQALPFTGPNVNVACGADGTAVIQAAINAANFNRGVIALPPCAKTSPIVISATLLVPDNVSILGTGRSVTWLQAGTNLNAPLFENLNNAGGGGITLNSNIEIGFLSIDGNGSNQSHVLANNCIYFLGVDRPSVHDLEIDNCDSTAIKFDGNSNTTSNGGFVNNIFVNGTVGNGSNPLMGVGLQVSNAQRGMQVSNITTYQTHGYGVLIDASEGNWSSIRAKASGTGLVCPNSGSTTVVNPGGGGASQSNWTPCAAGIYIRNVADLNAVNLLASEGQYYGVVVVGCRHCTFDGVIGVDNSLRTSGVWNDLHFDLNVFLSVGRGETHNLSLVGAVLGANSQLGGASPTNTSSAPTSAYGLYIADGLAGSVGDATVATGGTGCTLNDALTASGGTSSIASKWIAGNVGGGVVTGIKHDFTTGGGVYTSLPANPITLTGGTCSVAPTINVTWSTAVLSNITIGQTVTGAARIPAMQQNWSIKYTGARDAQRYDQELTAGTTWTSPAWVNAQTNFKFTLIGGGGGGGGCNTSSVAARPGGAAAGAVWELNGLAPSTAYTIAIGLAGTAGAATPTAGGNGGDTTIAIGGTTVTAGGGVGGIVCGSGNGTTAGGVATNGTIRVPGKLGQSLTTNVSFGGDGPFGMGAGAMTATAGAAGSAGTGYGAGGSGGVGLAQAGGAGAPGLIRIEAIQP